MATRVATAGTYNSGDVIHAADLNAMPGGSIGRDTLSANSTGTTTTETVLSVAPTVGTSREVDVHATVNLRASTATNGQCTLFEDGVQIQRKNAPIPATGTDVPITTFITRNPTAGAHTYSVVTGVSGSGGTVTCVNNGGGGTFGASQLLVVDGGPAF